MFSSSLFCNCGISLSGLTVAVKCKSKCLHFLVLSRTVIHSVSVRVYTVLKSCNNNSVVNELNCKCLVEIGCYNAFSGDLINTLAYSNEICGNNQASVAYSTVYPLTMFLRVVTAQIMVLMAL